MCFIKAVLSLCEHSNFLVFYIKFLLRIVGLKFWNTKEIWIRQEASLKWLVWNNSGSDHEFSGIFSILTVEKNVSYFRDLYGFS